MTFEELLTSKNITIAPRGHHHGRAGWVNFDCPYCGLDSKAFHMGYNVAHGYVNCWRCGPHNVAETLGTLFNCSPFQATQTLKAAGITRVARVEALTGTLRLPPTLGPLGPQHKAYLRSRGFIAIGQLAALWSLQGLGLTGNGLAHRIFIPIQRYGKTISWQARATTPTARRYISADAESEAFPAKQWLYGFDYVGHSAVFCEGPTDVWRIGPGACATLGTGYTAAQVALMVKAPQRVICFDNAPAAQQRATALLNILSVYPGVTFNVVLDAPDPGSAGPAEIKALRRAFLE